MNASQLSEISRKAIKKILLDSAEEGETSVVLLESQFNLVASYLKDNGFSVQKTSECLDNEQLYKVSW